MDRIELYKNKYNFLLGLVDKISAGQKDFIPHTQAQARSLLGKNIPDSVFRAANPRDAFILWLAEAVNPVIVSPSGYREEIRVFDDSPRSEKTFDFFEVKDKPAFFFTDWLGNKISLDNLVSMSFIDKLNFTEHCIEYSVIASFGDSSKKVVGLFNSKSAFDDFREKLRKELSFQRDKNWILHGDSCAENKKTGEIIFVDQSSDEEFFDVRTDKKILASFDTFKLACSYIRKITFAD